MLWYVLTHMLNKLYHVQITFSHSRVLTMEQQRACNHTVQNTETNSNYLVESMSATDSYRLLIPLSVPISHQVLSSPGQTPATFIYEILNVHASAVSQFLVQPLIVLRYDGGFWNGSCWLRDRVLLGLWGPPRDSHSTSVTGTSGRHTDFK